MNLEQMQDAVRLRMGVPVADSFVADPVLIDLINEAVQVYAMEEDWPWLEETVTFNSVANQEAYDTPADWVRTAVVTPDSDYPLRYISINETRQRNEVGGLSNGLYPDSYTIQRDKILLSPIPQAVRSYTHDYIKAETTLVSPTDVPFLPTQWRYMIVCKAVALAYMRDNNMERALSWERQYDKWLTRMRDNRKRTTAFTQVRVRPGSMI